MHLAGRAVLDDLAVGQDHDAVGGPAGEADLVRHQDQRQAVALQVFEHLEHFVLQLRIEGAGDLVAEQAARLHRQGAGDGHALLLAAGELARIGVGPVRQADAVAASSQAALARLGRGTAQHADRRLDDVLQRRQVREELKVLEDHAEQPAHLAGPRALPWPIAGRQDVCGRRGSRRRRRRSSPLRQRSSVDLPPPLGPISATVSPGCDASG